MNGDNTSLIKPSKLCCDICFKYDEFSLCEKCFSVYREKSINFRKQVKAEKYQLKSAIQEIINKNYQTFIYSNKKSERFISLDRLQKKINDAHSRIKYKQNLIIEIKEKIKTKKLNLKRMKEILFKEYSFLDKGKNANFQGQKIMEEKKYNKEKMSSFYLNYLLNLIFYKRIEIEEFFEIQEYVKPDISQNNNLQGNASGSNSNNLTPNDMKEFDKLPNVLSVSNSGVLFNYNHKEFDINYDKVIRIKPEILKNKNKIFVLNNFIYSLILFQKNISVELNINLPNLFQESDIMKIKSGFTDNICTLYLDYDINIHNENYFNELIQGYMYLDINLKIIISYLKPELIKREVKKYKNCFSYGYNSNHIFDLKEFLNINKLLPKLQDSSRDKDKILNAGRYGEIIDMRPDESFEVKIISVEDKKIKEEEGFVIIDNFYT
jgi:hypothetical protein